MDDSLVRREIASMAAEGFLLTLDSLSEWVEQARVRAGLNKAQLARDIGIERSTLWRFNKGMNVDTLVIRKIHVWLRDVPA